MILARISLLVARKLGREQKTKGVGGGGGRKPLHASRSTQSFFLTVSKMPSRLFALVLFATGFLIPTALNRKANFIVFLADDLGYADLGCFGNDSLKTPNLDRLAANGVKLTHNLSPESICTPSRAAFLTGRYPIRTGLASSPNSIRVIIFTSARAGLPPSERTFANELRTVGYSTGLF